MTVSDVKINIKMKKTVVIINELIFAYKILSLKNLQIFFFF